MDLWHLNNMKVILTLLALNYVDSVPFLCITFFRIVQNRANQYPISELAEPS